MLIIHVLISGVIGFVWMACFVIDASEASIRPLSILCLALVIWLFYSWRSVGRSAFDPYGFSCSPPCCSTPRKCVWKH